MRIHILGASGAGTTTLGRALARALDIAFFDTDDFYWLPTDPPYREKRLLQDRVRLMSDQFTQHDRWLLSGSLVNWSEKLEPYFTNIVFVSLDQEVRLQRLVVRESERYGPRLLPGGDLHKHYVDFLAYAARYDGGSMDIRSRVLQERWLQRFDCPILRLDSIQPAETLVEETIRWLSENPSVGPSN